MPDPIDVYLLWGQSNTTGYGSADEVPQALKAPHPSVRIFHAPLDGPEGERSLRPASRTWAALAPGFGAHPGGFGPELSLGPALAQAAQVPVALIKCEEPGTGLFDRWCPDNPNDANTLTNRALEDAAQAIEQLLEEGHDPRIAGLVWFQGESDTLDANHEPERFGPLLRTLVERIQEELNDGRTFPKAYVRVNPADPDAKHLGFIRQQIEAAANADPKAAWIDVDDLTLIDPWHLNGESLLKVGQRAAEKLIALTPTEPIEPQTPAATPLAASNPMPAKPSAAEKKPRIIALMNQKGGVGKTTTSVNVGAALANQGHSVLVIDLDPQAHLTLSLGIEPTELDKSLYDLFTDPATTAMEVVRQVPPDSRNLAILPAETNLAGIESELSEQVATGLAQTLLRNKTADLCKQFDYVLLDCPPSLGLLTINGLTMASEIIVPMQAHFLALQGMTKLFETIGMVRGGINPALTVSGVVLCMHEANTILANDVISEVEGFFEAARNTEQPWANAQVYQPPIRRNIKLAEAPSFGQSVIAYAPESNGAKDYLAVAQSIAAGL